MLRAFQWDLARQVERLDHLLALLPRYAAWGYQRLYLHLEDAVDYPSLPGVARADAWRWAELEMLVSTAQTHGIAVVPIANLLGHTQYLIRHSEWRALNELLDPATGEPMAQGQICPLHPRTPEVAARLMDDLAPLCTAGELHAGLDESFHLGKHPLSRAEIAGTGLAGHFARYVTRLHGLAAERGLRLGLWADMLALLPEAIPALPARAGLAAYDWYYHPFGRRPKMELYGFHEYELAPALRAAGVAYWACPMNGAFRHEVAPVWGDRLQNIAAWWRRARATEAAGVLISSWEPYRLALPATTLVDAAAATLWLEPARGDDPASLLAAGLRRAHGLGAAEARGLARGLLGTDTAAFAGNARWEINTRWDAVGARRESPRPHARADRQFRRLAARADTAAVDTRDARPALAWLPATLRFQAYLAARDAFVRTAASTAARLRRLAANAGNGAAAASQRLTIELAAASEQAAEFAVRLRAARLDARRMWVASRPASTFSRSQNAAVLRGDGTRLRSWQAWLRAVARRPAHARRASPPLGRWTLRFTAQVETPAWQKVVVEQQTADGGWREIYGRVLIEFRGYAARSRVRNLRFEFACPLKDPEARLRIATRCVGQVAISQVELTDGVQTRTLGPAERRARRLLGEAPTTTDWPRVDWVKNTGEWQLTWATPTV